MCATAVGFWLFVFIWYIFIAMMTSQIFIVKIWILFPSSWNPFQSRYYKLQPSSETKKCTDQRYNMYFSLLPLPFSSSFIWQIANQLHYRFYLLIKFSQPYRYILSIPNYPMETLSFISKLLLRWNAMLLLAAMFFLLHSRQLIDEALFVLLVFSFTRGGFT